MFERWDHPLAQALTLRDGSTIKTLADARDAITRGPGTTLNSEALDLAIGLLDEAAQIGGSRAVERATDRTRVALIYLRQI